MSRLKLHVVILNWHAAADTVRCVQALSAWTHLEARIWVVDNASQDDSLAVIKAACPHIKLIANPQNDGFAGGSNRGLLAALAEDDSPICLLNNDAHLPETSVRQLCETIHNEPQVGLVAPLLYHSENPDQLISAGGKNPVLHQQTRHLEKPETATQTVDVVSGTAVILNPAMLRAVGLLDERYFFSTELADLCRRAQTAGYRVLVDGRAKAYHDVGRSSALRNTLYTYYIIRNRFIYLRKFYSGGAKFALFSLWSAYGVALSLKLRLQGERATAQAVWLAQRDAWAGRFGGQNERVLALTGQADSKGGQ